MIITCKWCNKSFNKEINEIKNQDNYLCSHSCFVSFNNKENPKRKRTKKCKYCNTLILSSRQKCEQCIENILLILDDEKISDTIYKNHHKSSAFALIRSRARTKAKTLGWNSCKHCGYDKHIEICHIKAIKDFPEDSLISEVNHIDNLLPLCPNCHWEFDNDLYTI